VLIFILKIKDTLNLLYFVLHSDQNILSITNLEWFQE